MSEIGYGEGTSTVRHPVEQGPRKKYEAPAVRHEDVYENMLLACIVVGSMSGGESTCQG